MRRISARTPDIAALRSTLGRPRTAAVVAAALVVAVVVVANQPRGGGTPVAAVAATATGTPVMHPPATGAPALRLLHERISFHATPAGDGRPAPALAATEGILVDVDDRTILWSRDPHRPHAPASTTKVLSTLVALENFAPDRQVTVTADALTQAGDETVMGLRAGQTLSVSELLTGMLLASANDAATALAVDTVGIPAFVAAMNRQISALGLSDSHFTTPVGLDDPRMQASPYDLAAVAVADVTNFALFRQIVSETDAVLPASSLHPEFDLHNLNRLLRIYPPADGIKPGWTGDAGPCLVGMAERDGHRLIAVLIDDQTLYTDARALLDWGFTEEGLPPLVTPSPHP